MDGTRKPIRRASEMESYDLVVKFPPKVLHHFNRLAVFVEGSEHFSPEILENLQDYAHGKPQDVQRAMSGIAHVVQEAMKHIHATGDKRAQQALDGLMYEIMEGDPPIAVTHRPRTRGRE